MKNINIICVDDQREVLNTIALDLQVFEQYVNLEECESAEEALEVMDDIDTEGGMIGIIISDHVMPDMSGVDFLSAVKADKRFKDTRKVLLTGLATHQDTITAINQAGIDYYIEKPWDQQQLQSVVRRLLTAFVLDSGKDYMAYMDILDKEVLFATLKDRMGGEV